MLEQLIPQDLIAGSLGPETGLLGILLACLLGAILPGGPYVSFPPALLFWQRGAGEPQMIALLTAWSVFALHRVIAFEIPILGPRFVLLRILASGPLVPLAGVLASLFIMIELAQDTHSGEALVRTLGQVEGSVLAESPTAAPDTQHPKGKLAEGEGEGPVAASIRSALSARR